MMRSKTRSLRAVLAGLGLSAAALTVMLVVSGPVMAGLSDAGGVARSGSGLVGAWQHRTASVLTGKADRILLLVRCPIIRNGSLVLGESRF
ncbi:hypothetical protein DMB66_43055 [Actinoplanes sp. ATCC 53533]|uniref:hypothetical protein n=1 Tax=Actinoplanes sp. ATCC 53533 TaxID=1288362 RepID=UPI0010003CB8|nr:hypothetical protein [Actinoplanes sp. ATCC 53533]RSM50986.1 hypothetical protein DMB66_43055 [Actinoplanes sp. ATCC 53533]